MDPLTHAPYTCLAQIQKRVILDYVFSNHVNEHWSNKFIANRSDMNNLGNSCGIISSVDYSVDVLPDGTNRMRYTVNILLIL